MPNSLQAIRSLRVESPSDARPTVSVVAPDLRRAARHDVVVTIDDDLQYPRKEAPKLLSELGEGFDVVDGAPEREQHGFLRYRASQITEIALQNAMGANMARHVSAFRAFHTRLRDAFERLGSPFIESGRTLCWHRSPPSG
jgi:undecaprenyl-phosphate 4-deoxy-4-formamido-L-arabinose transferase